MPEVLLGLIWVQTVCKGYQQMTQAADDCGHEWALEKNNFLSSSQGFYKIANAIIFARTLTKKIWTDDCGLKSN